MNGFIGVLSGSVFRQRFRIVHRHCYSSMARQLTSSLLMVRPAAFGLDEETAMDNTFQSRIISMKDSEISQRAKEEFDKFVQLLRSNGVKVVVVDDTETPIKPDACFPNNWISFHSDEKKIVIYPMMSKSRHFERREDIVQKFKNALNWDLLDLTHYEDEEEYLEGTGSMVFDRVNKIAYASKSHRTNPKLVNEFCRLLGYKPLIFTSAQTSHGKDYPVYHTNVLLSIGERLAVICDEIISESETVLKSLRESGKQILRITEDQMKHYAGNVLQVGTSNNKSAFVMSESAYNCLSSDQISVLKEHGEIIAAPIHVIETIGGGSARCMLAELFDD